MQPLEIELQIKLVFQTFPNINLICCNQSKSTKLPDDGATAADSHFTTLGVKFAPFPVSLSLSLCNLVSERDFNSAAHLAPWVAAAPYAFSGPYI